MALRLLYYFFLFGAGILSALLSSANSWGAEKLKVSVSIMPQKYFVQRIGGDLVDVSVMVLPGASPATYEPKPKQMVGLTRSGIYFALGVPFEKVWLTRFSAANPRMKIVHTDEGIEKMPMKAHHAHEKPVHHEEKGRDHLIKDPHIWLSPLLVKIQARNILHALLKAEPGHRSFFETNYKEFSEEIDRLDAELRNIFAPKKGHIHFMVYHPAWGYFARAYGLNQITIQIEGKEPKPKRLQGLIDYAKGKGVKVIFVQPQFSTKSAETIAKAIGAKVVFADPLALDWPKNLRQVAKRISSALK